ncbi:transposase [Streptomyces sp. NPDC005009]
MQLLGCVLSLRSRSGEQVPSLTAQIARASNPDGTTAIWVRDRLDGLWHDEDFADWYPRDGRPGLSPAQPATVGVLQFVPGLSDRQAVEAVRCRIDFKYALAMELDDPDFHHSVPADSRERLAQDDRADRLPDLPGPARHPTVEVLANAGQSTSTAPRSPAESSQAPLELSAILKAWASAGSSSRTSADPLPTSLMAGQAGGGEVSSPRGLLMRRP